MLGPATSQIDVPQTIGIGHGRIEGRPLWLTKERTVKQYDTAQKRVRGLIAGKQKHERT
jgi:hypothetical protein